MEQCEDFDDVGRTDAVARTMTVQGCGGRKESAGNAASSIWISAFDVRKTASYQNMSAPSDADRPTSVPRLHTIGGRELVVKRY